MSNVQILQQYCEQADKTPSLVLQPIAHYSSSEVLAATEKSERLLASIKVLTECLSDEPLQVDSIDKTTIDIYIAKIDALLSQQLDAILHHPDWQAFESLWRSVSHVLTHGADHRNSWLELLDVSQQELADDFEQSASVANSSLYTHLYHDEYDTPGGEPFSAVISDWDFSAEKTDIDLLDNIARVCQATHAPFIGNVSLDFFHCDSWNDLVAIDDLDSHFDKTEYLFWRDLRQCDHARYLGLTLPKFILRAPYDHRQPCKDFNYHESTVISSEQSYLWGAASFAFAANLRNSFADHGWLSNIRGSQGGGKVTDLAQCFYPFADEILIKPPTQVTFSESNELTLASLGFIPLCHYKQTNYACFFSANSLHQPQLYNTDHANANARVNARLPYTFLSSRLAHYLKVLYSCGWCREVAEKKQA